MEVKSLVRPVQVLPSSERTSNGCTHPVITTTTDGERVVFKHNDQAPAWCKKAPLLGKALDRVADEQDVGEVLASHLMTDELGLPALTYRQAFYVDGDGQTHAGIASDFIPGFKTLSDVGPEAIRNPDQAVAQQVARAWMGDWDCIDNRNNTWIMPDGQALAVDFGEALKDGVRTSWLPDANRDIMRVFGTPERVNPMLVTIAGKSDDDIRDMVDRVGTRYIENWSPAQLEKYSGVLIRNRNRLQRQHPFQPNPLLGHLLHNPLADKVTHFFTFGPGASPRSVLTHVGGVLAQKLHLPPYYNCSQF